MDRNRLIAVFLAIGGIVAIVYLSKRFVSPTVSPYPQTPSQDETTSLAPSTTSSSAPGITDAVSSADDTQDGNSSSSVSVRTVSLGDPVPVLPSQQALGHIRLPDGATYAADALSIFTRPAQVNTGGPLMLRVDATLRIGNRAMPMRIFYRPNADMTLEQLQRLFPNAVVTEANTGFGMGNEYEMLAQDDAGVVSTTSVDGLPMKKFIRDWGSGVSSDVAAYLFPQASVEWADAILVDVFNVWPDATLPPTLNSAFIDQLHRSGDARAAPYVMVDQLVRSFTF